MPLPFAHSYAFPPGGMPPPTDDPAANGAIFTTAYALIPASVQRDIVTSLLPGWRDTRAWILARPLSGFAETFAQYAVEVAPGGGSDTPEPDAQAEALLFVASGELALNLPDSAILLPAGGFAYIGLEPNTAFAPDSIKRDDQGRLVTNDTLETALPGVWAVGAVRSGCGGSLDDAIADANRAADAVAARLK